MCLVSPRNMMTYPEADNGIVTPANSSVTCSADGNPPPTYVWTSSDDYLSSGGVLDLTDPNLNNNINGRMFVCTASNFVAGTGYDSSLNITLSGGEILFTGIYIKASFFLFLTL